MVVLAIIGILAIIVVNVIKNAKTRAKDVTCKHRLGSLALEEAQSYLEGVNTFGGGAQLSSFEAAGAGGMITYVGFTSVVRQATWDEFMAKDGLLSPQVNWQNPILNMPGVQQNPNYRKCPYWEPPVGLAIGKSVTLAANSVGQGPVHHFSELPTWMDWNAFCFGTQYGTNNQIEYAESMLSIGFIHWGYDTNGYNRGFNAGYLDGHAAWMSSNAFKADTNVIWWDGLGAAPSAPQ